jgi:hypothetical protein
MKNIFYTISKIRKVGMLQDDSYLYKVTTKNSYWFLRLQKANSSYNRSVGNYEFFSKQ